MNPSDSTMSREIARAVSAWQRQNTRHAPRAVTVGLSAETLVVTLHEALAPAEKALAGTPQGAAQVQEYHRQLFAGSVAAVCEEIKRITGVAVREAAAEIEPTTGAVVQVFTTGTMVQVFLLAESLPEAAWSGSGDHEPANRGSVRVPGEDASRCILSEALNEVRRWNPLKSPLLAALRRRLACEQNQ